jgi:hypothetical protein
MNEEISESSITEQEGKYVRKLFTANAVLEHPAPANTIQDATAADWAARAEGTKETDEVPVPDDNTHDIDDQLDSALELITPIECPLVPENRHGWSIFTRPGRNQPFTIVGKPIEVYCFEMAMHHEHGQYTGEAYFPMNSVLREQLKVSTRALALHPAISYPDKPFIFPQVLERRSSERNDRDTSLQTAIRTAPGNWMELWYDEDIGRFQYLHEAQDPEDAPEYPGFVWDCLNALGESFILHPEHPLQLLIREQQQLYM